MTIVTPKYMDGRAATQTGPKVEPENVRCISLQSPKDKDDTVAEQ